MKRFPRKRRSYTLEKLPRPAYLDYPYTDAQMTSTFWMDHRRQIWGIVIGIVIAYGIWLFIGFIVHLPSRLGFEFLC
jgi:hypothetical protein